MKEEERGVQKERGIENGGIQRKERGTGKKKRLRKNKKEGGGTGKDKRGDRDTDKPGRQTRNSERERETDAKREKGRRVLNKRRRERRKRGTETKGNKITCSCNAPYERFSLADKIPKHNTHTKSILISP